MKIGQVTFGMRTNSMEQSPWGGNIPQLFKEFPSSVESEDSLPCSQEAVTSLDPILSHMNSSIWYFI
jgi:hypothetical protein